MKIDPNCLPSAYQKESRQAQAGALERELPLTTPIRINLRFLNAGWAARSAG